MYTYSVPESAEAEAGVAVAVVVPVPRPLPYAPPRAGGAFGLFRVYVYRYRCIQI